MSKAPPKAQQQAEKKAQADARCRACLQAEIDIERLEQQLAAVEESRNDLINERQEMRGLLPECLVEYGPDLVGALRQAMQRLAEVTTRLRQYEPEPGRCEHDVAEGDWCEPCNLEYKRAAREATGDEHA